MVAKRRKGSFDFIEFFLDTYVFNKIRNFYILPKTVKAKCDLKFT